MTPDREPTDAERLARELVADDFCPLCGGELDTGWECNRCGYDGSVITQEIPSGF